MSRRSEHETQFVGAIGEIRRHPVKSMQGETLDRARLSADGGVAGDRAFAVLDVETGRVASAKHPRQWERVFACRATYATGAADAPVRIRLPDGAEVTSDDPDVHRALSRALGRTVRLISRAEAAGRTREADRTPDGGESAVIREEPLALAAPAGSFFDVAPLHLLATATLARLTALAPESRFEPVRFRPNLVVRLADAPHDFVENGWIGRALLVGGAVRLSVIDPTPRCVVTTLAVSGLPRDPDVLRTAVRANAVASHTVAPGAVFPGVVGVYATAERGGEVRVGDGVVVEG